MPGCRCLPSISTLGASIHGGAISGSPLENKPATPIAIGLHTSWNWTTLKPSQIKCSGSSKDERKETHACSGAPPIGTERARLEAADAQPEDEDAAVEKRDTSDSEASEFDATSAARKVTERKSNVVRLEAPRKKKWHESARPQPNIGTIMADAPTREEINARLEAAEARTEARFTQLGATIEARSSVADHKIDLVSTKIDSLVTAFTEMKNDVKSDIKKTREVTITVGVSAVIAIIAVFVALWIAGINVEGNMISAFQAGLATDGSHRSESASSTTQAVQPTVPQPTTPPSGATGKH